MDAFYSRLINQHTAFLTREHSRRRTLFDLVRGQHTILCTLYFESEAVEMCLWDIPVIERYSIIWVFLVECKLRNSFRRNVIIEDMIQHIMLLPENEYLVELRTVADVSTQCAKIFQYRHTFERYFTDELLETPATLLGGLGHCVPLDERKDSIKRSSYIDCCQEYVSQLTQRMADCE